MSADAERRSRAGIAADPHGEVQPAEFGLRHLADGFADAYAGVRNLDLPITAVARHRSISKPSITATDLATAVGIFLIAALPRLLVLFLVTDLDNPGFGWYNDTFHHWQIGYLSKEIGFSQGFLRLWDFKGMEYFWGLLHPLLLAVLFEVTGSIDILIPRFLSLAAGSAVIVILFFLLKRHFGIRVAIAGALFGILNPVQLFADTAGLLQPIAIFLTVLGIWCWPRNALWAGITLALAGTVRAEYWVFGAGLAAVSMLSKEESGRKLAIAIGWLTPTLLYMIYMNRHTGNPIYPVYWNFLGNIAGEWIAGRPLGDFQTAMQSAGRIAVLGASVAAAAVLRRRDQSHLFVLFGLGNVIFLGLTFGVGAYVHGVIPRILVARLMVVPYLYAAILMSSLAVKLSARAVQGHLSGRIFWLATILIVGSAQFAWKPILGYYEAGRAGWASVKQLAAEIGANYSGRTVLIPEGIPQLTYALVRYEIFSAEDLQSQMYDPFFYANQADPFEDWESRRGEMSTWLKSEDMGMIVVASHDQDYFQLVEREPGWFNLISAPLEGSYQLWEVTDALWD